MVALLLHARCLAGSCLSHHAVCDRKTASLEQSFTRLAEESREIWVLWHPPAVTRGSPGGRSDVACHSGGAARCTLAVRSSDTPPPHCCRCHNPDEIMPRWGTLTTILAPPPVVTRWRRNNHRTKTRVASRQSSEAGLSNHFFWTVYICSYVSLLFILSCDTQNNGQTGWNRIFRCSTTLSTVP